MVKGLVLGLEFGRVAPLGIEVRPKAVRLAREARSSQILARKVIHRARADSSFILDSKIQDSGPDQIGNSKGYQFYYEVLGDSCEVLGAKRPVTMRIRGNTMRCWG